MRIPKHLAVIPDGNRRWGGGRRLSGFLPLQAVYSDFFIIEDYWPDFSEDHFKSALDWYNIQDITLGG